MAIVGQMKENEQELRLALAMRGGASMAVWIGGAAAEINCLRRVPSEDTAHPWAALAKLAGYDSVSVDVLAGTSAGGLNAALLSASVVYGMPFNDMRAVWIQLADLEAMSRPVPKFWQRDPISLLDGDGYFRSELVRILKQRLPTPGKEQTPGRRAELLLTATLLDPLVERCFDDRGGSIEQERRSASFRFRHSGEPGQPLSDFGAGEDFADTALRLAHAARATSAFPFAFEPAQVHSGVSQPPSGEPNMVGIFSEATADTQPFRVIDGGVLDNIPVTAAIRSIADAPAQRPTERWLLYLNPEPTPASEDRPFRRQLALPVASVALQAKFGEESLLVDIEALEEHNRAVERMGLVRRSLFAEIRAAEPAERPGVLAAKAAAVEPENAVVRAELDAHAVYQLLTDPSGAEDGKLTPPVIGDPLVGWSGAAKTELFDRLSARMAESAGTDGVFDDARALLSRIQHCLSWVWDIERWAPETRLPELGACKGALYRLRTLGRVLEGHADRYWVNAAKQEPIIDIGELDGWVDRVLSRRQRVQQHLPSPIQPLVGAVLEAIEEESRFDTALSELATELLSIVESSGADAVSDNGTDDAHQVNVVAEATAVLHGVADRIAASAAPRTRIDEPQQLGYALLETSAHRPEVLRQLVVLTAALDVGRAPGSPINLLRLSGNQQTPLPFDALRRHEHAPLWLEDKIRGGDLGNFASFLSAKWRANDWMWGRLDAATSLIALLLDPTRLVRRNAALGAEGLCDALGAIIATVTRGELGDVDDQRLGAWQTFLAELWEQRKESVRAELDALFASPEGDHSLEETKKALSERLHWTIAATEVPYVTSVSPAAETVDEGAPSVCQPQRLAEDVRDYAVGRQRLGDLGLRRLATVATRFSLLAYRAALPAKQGVFNRLGRIALTVLKPLLMAIVFAFAAPRRAASVAFLAATSVAFSGLAGFRFAEPAPSSSLASPFPRGVAASSRGVAEESSGWSLYTFAGGSIEVSTLLLMVVVAVFAVWLCHQFVAMLGEVTGGRIGRWVSALILAGALIAVELLALFSGFRLRPLGLLLVALALTAFATVAYRLAGRLIATLVTAVTGLCFAGATVVLTLWWPSFSLWLLSSPVLGDAWVLLGVAAIGYAQTLLLATVDVLRPPPGA